MSVGNFMPTLKIPQTLAGLIDKEFCRNELAHIYVFMSQNSERLLKKVGI